MFGRENVPEKTISRCNRSVLRQCDRDEKLAYIEALNSKNIPFYERHGFKLLATIQEGASSPIFPMVR
jgi:hypothetical protein